MAVKLFAFYDKPADEAAFWKHYKEVHTPLVHKLPGLQSFTVNRVTGSPMGEPVTRLTVKLCSPGSLCTRGVWTSL